MQRIVTAKNAAEILNRKLRKFMGSSNCQENRERIKKIVFETVPELAEDSNIAASVELLMDRILLKESD